MVCDLFPGLGRRAPGLSVCIGDDCGVCEVNHLVDGVRIRLSARDLKLVLEDDGWNAGDVTESNPMPNSSISPQGSMARYNRGTQKQTSP